MAAIMAVQWNYMDAVWQKTFDLGEPLRVRVKISFPVVVLMHLRCSGPKSFWDAASLSVESEEMRLLTPV